MTFLSHILGVTGHCVTHDSRRPTSLYFWSFRSRSGGGSAIEAKNSQEPAATTHMPLEDGLVTESSCGQLDAPAPGRAAHTGEAPSHSGWAQWQLRGRYGIR